MSFECKHQFMEWCIRKDGKPQVLDEVWIDAWNAAVKACEEKAWSKRDKWDEGDGFSPAKASAAEEIGCAIRNLEYSK